jgi:hypothetical protein
MGRKSRAAKTENKGENKAWDEALSSHELYNNVPAFEEQGSQLFLRRCGGREPRLSQDLEDFAV